MKMPNRCPSCRNLIFGYKKVRDKGFMNYKNFCPHCGVELVIEVKSYILLLAPIITAGCCLYFLIKGIDYLFSKLIIVSDASSVIVALSVVKLLVLCLSIAAFVMFSFFIGNKAVKVRKAAGADTVLPVKE
jgi:hypothetical protein